MKKLTQIALASVSLIGLIQPMQAYAQDQSSADRAPADEATDDVPDSEIVVTGTLIRGTAVTGSQTIVVGAEEIAAKGATSTNELLTIIPQIANAFNGRFDGDPRGVSAGISISKPNLRNFPSSNSTSGGLTLVLMDGMRLTPVGVNQAATDVDIIPGAVLEGVDVVTDGGSSLYGADAVAGVINFRTLRKFDGLKVDGNFGFGTTVKGFHEWDATITGGISWDGGNAYISAGHSDRDGILNGQVPWSSGLVYTAAGVPSFAFTQCPSPVGTETRFFRFGAGAANFTSNPAAPGAGVFPVGKPCDSIAAQSYLPRQERDNVFAAVSQEFGDNVDLRVTGYYTKRDTTLAQFPRGFTSAGSTLTTGALVGAAFPNAAVGSITVIPGGTGFSFSTNSAYVNTPTRVGFETGGITPELTVKLGSNWQVRTSGHYGRSTNFQSFPGIDAVKAQCYITGCTGIAAGQLNPLNAAAASAAVINDITNYENAQDTKQELILLRSVADGAIFALPGGDAKLAVGVEYQRNKAESRLTAGPVGSLGSVPYMEFTRNAKSVFGEVSLPVTNFLDVNGSVRYDDYSDFGSTTNPNIGFALRPFEGLKIFGHWNSSYNAPTAIDGLAIATGRFVCGIYTPNGTAAQRPTDPLKRDLGQGSCAMVLQGSKPNLQPQTADSWAVGFEATPGGGFRFGGEFYSIDAKNTLGALNPSIISTYTTNPDLYTYNVNATGYAAVLATLTNGAALGLQQPANNIAIIVDTRTTNLNSAKIEGIDFHAYYDYTGESGHHWAFGMSGTYATKSLQVNGGVLVDKLGRDNPRLFTTTFAAWDKGALSARLTVNYSGKYRDQATNNVGTVERVDRFIVTNLNLGYNIKDTGGPLDGTSFRVIVDNLFEAKPETIRRANTNNLSYNGFTLGRVIKLGLSKKF